MPETIRYYDKRLRLVTWEPRTAIASKYPGQTVVGVGRAHEGAHVGIAD